MEIDIDKACRIWYVNTINLYGLGDVHMPTNYNIFENETAFQLYQELITMPGIIPIDFGEERITVDVVRQSLGYANLVLNQIPFLDQ